MHKKFIFIFSILALILFFSIIALHEKEQNTLINQPGYTLAENQKYKEEILQHHQLDVNNKASIILQEIERSRQNSRNILSTIITENGPNSIEAKSYFDQFLELENKNLEVVCQLIDQHGWLGPDRIGAQNNYTLFTTIQNSDLTTQNKYLSIMEDAVKKGNLNAELYAILVDRKSIIEHGVQIFGTLSSVDLINKARTISTVVDKININQRRVEIGLSPIEI
ncbi:MAG: hypothetical protein IPM51_11305 [Sphingobacteriaceae bacterium]|nr:hypothetical protein [Sphingobacteriaceae bacterium]